MNNSKTNARAFANSSSEGRTIRFTTIDESLVQNHEWIVSHLILNEGNEDRRICLRRNDFLRWLRENWSSCYSSVLEIESNEKTFRCLLRRIAYRPGKVQLQDAVRYVELCEANRVIRSPNMLVKLFIQFKNVKQLKFGIFVAIRKFVMVRLNGIESAPKRLEIDVPKHVSPHSREIRVKDLTIDSSYKLVTPENELLCRILKSSKERKALHEEWVRQRKQAHEMQR